MPEVGPFGETFFDASERAMALALFVKSPAGGCVESVVTLETQRFLLFRPALITPTLFGEVAYVPSGVG